MFRCETLCFTVLILIDKMYTEISLALSTVFYNFQLLLFHNLKLLFEKNTGFRDSCQKLANL